MFSGYLEREEYEDDLYRDSEEDSGLSADSDVEGYLYSQLHYASSPKDATRGSVPEPNIQPQAGKPLVEKKKCIQPQPVPSEVIVIDSGSDMVLTSEDDGICSYKGSRASLLRKSLATKTPSCAAVPSSAPKRLPDHPVEVVVLGSDDSSEESSEEESDQCSDRSEGAGKQKVIKVLNLTSNSDSDTDSDGLEKWMILGEDKCKEDQSIQLNLEGSLVTDDLDSTTWKISDRDQQAQIANKTPGDRRSAARPARRYYTEKSVICNNCNLAGHLSKNCPKPQKLSSCLHCGHRGHFYRDCPAIYCRNCGLPGHTHDSCLEQSYWYKQCHRCNMKGHFQDACPEIWRQFHVTTHTGRPCKPANPQAHRIPPYCYNCSQRGHFGFVCSHKRMFSGTFPSLPFINYYDQPKDFKRRDHHLQNKARGLAEAGQLEFFPVHQTEAAVFSPPHKRQKTHNQGFQHNSQHSHKRKQENLLQSSSKPKDVLFKRTTHGKAQQKNPVNLPHHHQFWKKNLSTPGRDTNQTPHSQKKKKKKKKAAHGLLEDGEDFPRGPKPWTPHGSSMLFCSSAEGSGNKRRKQRRARDSKAAMEQAAGPADENLFSIKQRTKRRRR
ncbi:zinc finger CCHC domain-containing protein 7 [Alosa pseudoharengus]|uniref:zinc finger CCHC domain-containing protein 7 n=1 Tax=Alosa pseudoharengus TaxID=34774 RepID=UPI003F8A3076